MDSSPDLSLKLRRGSSDSRDNFYMDFAQGIDSDIEEVDNSAIARDPQQPPTPPLPVLPTLDDDLASLSAAVVMPPPPMLPLQTQPLPTLAEADDLPPTPPPHLPPSSPTITTRTTSHIPSSPPPSPTTSVLEMIPPPLFSPNLDGEMRARAQTHTHARPLPQSPPSETEDEGDDADDADVDEQDDGDAADDDDDDKSMPPPPLPPLPSNLSYVHGGGAHGVVSPPLTKSPSTSPSPPITPPPCAKLSLEKVVSPSATHVSPMPPLTPPSESDQSQPNSPPPLPHHAMNTSISPPLPRSESIHSGEDIDEEVRPSTPPPEFGETSDMMAAVLIAAADSTSLERMQGVLQGAAYQAGDENTSLNEDESTTITTPPSNGYSASSIIAPPAEHLGELEDDVGFMLADIPPPAGMEDEEDEEDEVEVEEEEASIEQRSSVSEPQPDELLTEEQTTENTHAGDEGGEEADEAANGVASGTPTPQATPTVSGSPKRRSGSIGTAAGGSVGSGSRAPSRSGSRSGSRKSARSHSGSVRGSLGSRAGSIAAASVASVAASISSGSQATPGAANSPQASIKSIRSPPAMKSPPLSVSFKRSPPPMARMQSPPEGDSPPMMPSPPKIRSPPPQAKSPPPMHSPPKVTSPPRVYSPPLISSPPMRKPEAESEASERDKRDELPQKSTGIDSLPSTSTAVVTSETITISAAAVTVAAATSLSYQDEHVVRPHLSSHHHYHLPHQFQHPHHQNHHTHSHGSVPVSTPTVPLSYAVDTRHKRAASSSGDRDDESSSSTACAPVSQRSPPPVTLVPAALPASQLLLAADAASHASVSPVRSASRLRDSSSHHRVTIDESNLPPDSNGDGSGGAGDGSGPPTPSSSSQQQLASTCDDRATGHLALMYHSHQLSNYPVLPAIRRTHRPSFVYPPMPRVKAGDALATLFSALYGKLLVVMGIAFPMAEVISTYIPPSFYEVYYLYLYIGSMIFLLFMYATLLWGRPKIPMNITSPSKSNGKTRSTSASDSMEESDTESNSTHNKHIPAVIPSARRPSLLNPIGRQHHYGSFYLRMGAVAFGIGSMIYSGLEFGQYFELNPDTKCHNVLLALTPATRMAFIFIQMYFIFLNNEQIKVYRYKIIARFGLMHMIGTNLAVWLNVLIQETKHEILTFYNPENRTLRISHRIPMHSRGHAAHMGQAVVTADPTAHLRIPRGLKGPYQIFECRRTNILGTLVQDASPFLFPCTIEYSLICAAILYVMWRSISRPPTPTPQRPDTISSPMKRSPHHYSVDCARAHKGLFVGILILVLTIISLILFFVLISRPDYVALAVTEVTICELLIYGTATIATLIGMIQMRHLQYDAFRSFSLDDILLVGAQTGTFLYNIFTVIAGHFTLRSDDMLVPINALGCIVQTACQTMFILDAGRRQAVKPEHIRKKPGREIVTFMLVVNLAMWAISTLEKSRAESHPIQLNFYGLWAWTIITHVSMPLAIFYRFHSTVCLCEIWKRAYKLKPAYM